METEEVIWGRNAVLEALRGTRPVRRLVVAQGAHEKGALAAILAEAKERHLPLQRLPREALDRLCGSDRHQGVALLTSAYEYADVEDILATARARGEEALVLVLDAVQDPQNLGTLIRTAEAAGAHGLILPRHRSAGLTAAVAKASAGAIEHLKAAQVPNLARALDDLKKAGLWVVGIDMAGEFTYDSADLNRALALVVGGEGQGVHRLIKEKCDFTVRLPMRGKIASLNAAVAGSIVLYEAARQRQRGRLPG